MAKNTILNLYFITMSSKSNNNTILNSKHVNGEVMVQNFLV